MWIVRKPYVKESFEDHGRLNSIIYVLWVNSVRADSVGQLLFST